jgi:hypothetical protein
MWKLTLGYDNSSNSLTLGLNLNNFMGYTIIFLANYKKKFGIFFCFYFVSFEIFLPTSDFF